MWTCKSNDYSQQEGGCGGCEILCMGFDRTQEDIVDDAVE